MSSNGGCARFMEMYDTASSGKMCSDGFSVGSVEYCRKIATGGAASKTSSSSPAATRLYRSLTSPPIVMSISSAYAGRRSSVDASHDGLRTMTIDLPGW